MKNIMKYAISALFALALLGSSVFAAAESTTVTNRGQVITVTTLEDMAVNVKDADMYQDFSIYPSRLGQTGKIVRWYDYDKLGGAEGNIKLLPQIAVPKGLLIRDGYMYTMTAVAPTITATNSIQLTVADDIIATATNVAAATGLAAIVPVGTVATTKTTSFSTNQYVHLVVEDGTLTAGKFCVVLDCELAP